MTLSDLADKLFDSTNVIVYDHEDPEKEIARYDGKDSIPEELMDKPIMNIGADIKDSLGAYIGVYVSRFPSAQQRGGWPYDD